MLQSSNIEHVKTFLTSKFNQAVLHVKPGSLPNLDELAALQPPLKHVAGRRGTCCSLRTVRRQHTGILGPRTPLAVHAKRHAMKISALGYTSENLQVGSSTSDFLRKDSDACPASARPAARHGRHGLLGLGRKGQHLRELCVGKTVPRTVQACR